MSKSIKEIITVSKETVQQKLFIKNLLVILSASIFLAVISQFKIQLGFVPITLQTLGIFLLGLCLTPKKAFFSVVFYLAEATCGQPVLAGGAVNSLWFLGPKAGYLISMPFAAYVISYVMQKNYKYNLLQSAVAVCLGQGVIYLFGLSFLSFYFGLKKAFFIGVVPFGFVMSLKVSLAICLSKPMQLLSKKLK